MSCALAAASATWAQAPPDTAFTDSVVALPEVRVTERRPTEAERRIPTAYTSEIRPGARGGAIDLLPDLMSQLPGVHVQQYGGLGAFSVVSVRGSSPGQVAVFLNGMPLSSAARSVVSLGDLPISAVERIDVYRGPTPLGFGVVGPGGAIDLVSPTGTAPPELRVMHGSFDTWDARAFASRASGAWSALIHGGLQASSGDFSYLDDNATPFNPTDDVMVTRANNRFEAWTGLGSVTWRPGARFHVTGRGEALTKRQGTPGLGALPARHTSLATTFGVAQIEAVVEPHGATPRVALRGSSDRTRSQFEDPHAELGLGSHDTDDRISADHAELELAFPLLPMALALEAGATARREEARLHDGGDAAPDPAPSRRLRTGAMLGLSFRPFQGRVLLHAGERWERFEDELHSVGVGGIERSRDVERTLRSPQLGARVAVGFGVDLKGNWSKADRPPDFMELFGNQGVVLGNPALEPEHVESWDAGASWRGVRGSTSAALTWAHFESRARDLILYTRNTRSTVRAMNTSASRVRGEEFALQLGAGALRASASLTLEEAIDAGDVPYWTGKRLPQRPGQEGYAQLLWSRGWLGLGTDVYALSDNYLDRYNRYRIDRRVLTGAWISLSPASWPLRLTLEGKNLGDERASDVAGFPLPGRTLFMACESRLGSKVP
ncbi:MAG TPA: TonB-dependent receptor [Candidatus Eisenbacteria bacterium]|nr:TonB-dependent receptor [Candidatus Eisenbacteria bacterium]